VNKRYLFTAVDVIRYRGVSTTDNTLFRKNLDTKYTNSFGGVASKKKVRLTGVSSYLQTISYHDTKHRDSFVHVTLNRRVSTVPTRKAAPMTIRNSKTGQTGNVMTWKHCRGSFTMYR
jgi:hypothetical protein